MNQRLAFLIFFGIVLTVYALVNFYIYRHTRVFFSTNQVGHVLKWAFIAIVISYPLGRVLEYLTPSVYAGAVVKVGSVWLGAMLYLTLLFVLVDTIRLTFWAAKHPLTTSTLSMVSIGVYAVTALIVIVGYINALYPRVNRIYVDVPKAVQGYSQLRVGVASDIHLGTLIGNGRLARFVRMMNDEEPDIILLAGDIFDEDLGPVIRNDMGALLNDLKAPLGVWAVTGNHEFIGGVEPAVRYLTDHGIGVIRDSVVTLNGLLNIVGRDDLQSSMRTGYNRKPLDSIMKGVDTGLLTILMDHQPYNLPDAVRNRVDLQVSGHTHHGQLWPISFITRAMFEVSRGHKLIGNTHVFVSTGYGTWGPPVRIGNRPEIGIITIRLSKGNSNP